MNSHDTENGEQTEPGNGRGVEKERRRYFRVEEEIILYYREIAPHEIPDQSNEAGLGMDPFTLSSSLDFLTQESRTLLRKLEKEIPDVAEFLKILERKIDLMARAFLSCETDLAEQQARRVSLSASGLSFDTDQPYTLGKVLELKMVLLPRLIGVVAYGRVIYCKKGRDHFRLPYQIAVDFVGLSDRDRELLIRYVVKQQMQQLRGKKQPAE
jgi:hypothetical protein